MDVIKSYSETLQPTRTDLHFRLPDTLPVLSVRLYWIPAPRTPCNSLAKIENYLEKNAMLSGILPCCAAKLLRVTC